VMILNENGRFRNCWDTMCLAFVLISAIVIPLRVVFPPDTGPGLTWVVYLLDLFFWIDICLNFHTSFQKGGVLHVDRRETRRHYLRSLFPVDLAANLPIELLVVAVSPQSQLVLLLSLFRLLRVVRFFAVLHRIESCDWMRAGYLRIIRFGLVLVIVAHWTACTWYGLASVDGFPADSWVAREELVDADAQTQYTRSLYWTITTLTTVGYGDISPGRNREYVLSIGVMLLGASMYAFIIANVASLLSNLHAAKARHYQHTREIIAYLHSRGVPREVADQIRGYYDYRWAYHSGISPDAFLENLPGPIRIELMTYLTRELVERVPLFQLSPEALKRALIASLESETYPPATRVIHKGEMAEEIFLTENP